MKTSRILIIVILTLINSSLNAQYFITGNFGLNASGGNSEIGTLKADKPSKFSFNVSPMVGKFLSQKIGVGIGFNYSFSKTKTPGNPETIEKSSSIGLAPFLRYVVINMDKFIVFGQANLGISYSHPNSTTVGTTDGPKTSSLYFNIVPGVVYKYNERISFQTFINVMSFGYYLTTTELNNNKETTSSFNMGGGLKDIVTLGSITIGAIYKF